MREARDDCEPDGKKKGSNPTQKSKPSDDQDDGGGESTTSQELEAALVYPAGLDGCSEEAVE